MNDVRQMLDGYSKRHMVCEAPADPTGFASSTACGSAFAFGHSSDIVNAAKGSPSAVKAVSDYFLTAPSTMATMVSNHDAFAGQRLFDQVSGDMAQYKLAANAASDRLEVRAAGFSQRAGAFIQRADDYSLAVVLFASSLFFAGISTRLRSSTARMVILGLGCALFLGSVIWIATFPVSLSL
jgi:hypothetical protein